MSYEEVVFKRSYINLLLLNAAIPGIKPMDDLDENDFGVKRTTKTNNKHKSYLTNDNGNSFFASLM